MATVPLRLNFWRSKINAGPSQAAGASPRTIRIFAQAQSSATLPGRRETDSVAPGIGVVQPSASQRNAFDFLASLGSRASPSRSSQHFNSKVYGRSACAAGRPLESRTATSAPSRPIRISGWILAGARANPASMIGRPANRHRRCHSTSHSPPASARAKAALWEWLEYG
jgi:hypothetical protein